MKVVADANILFSALLKDGLTRGIISEGFLEIYVPKFITEEFIEHLYELENKTKVSGKLLKKRLGELIGVNMILIPEREFSGFIKKAVQICPDEDDVYYFALALKLNCGIWSNDKRLKLQNKIKIYTTKEIKEFLEN
jgi:predicted nucleic acid-binding protein